MPLLPFPLPLFRHPSRIVVIIIIIIMLMQNIVAQAVWITAHDCERFKKQWKMCTISLVESLVMQKIP
jgi:hypothetical protein